MSEPVIDLQVRGAESFAAAARQLKAAGRGDLRKAMMKEIREQSKPLLDDLKNAFLTMPVAGVRGGGSKARSSHRGGRGSNHGLRRSVAGAIQLKMTASGKSTGIRVRIDRTKLPADQRNLPEALDRPGGWRHPVFGHDVWVQQHGQEVWAPTVARHADDLRAAILRGIESYTSQLEGDLK